jgi:tripartite-type tricarboxylate transporter receptor subunit TctC
MLPPDMAVDRVDLMRSAFSKVLLDNDFQEQFSKSRMVLDPAMGPEIERLIKSTNEAPERLIQTLKDMLSLR